MAKTKASTEGAKPAFNPLEAGTYQTMPTKRVKPNDYNPNVMSASTFASIVYGMQTEGWIGQPLIVLGRDETGAERNVIVDGEHRWRAAVELGFKEVPCFVLDGLTLVKAKALTIAMNQRRGAFDEAGLSALLASIEHDVPDLSLATGVDDKELAALLSAARLASDTTITLEDDEGAEADAPPARGRTRTGSHGFDTAQKTNVITLSFADGASMDAFVESVRGLASRYGTDGVVQTLITAVRNETENALCLRSVP